ncbi:uncharacterized protein ACRADG_010294 [Cochliomyia hominivorax]
MKCVNRYTGGVIIATFYILLYIIIMIVFIYIINIVPDIPDYKPSPTSLEVKILEFSFVVCCLLQIFSSALLIWSIQNRNHHFMKLWFVFFTIGFMFSCVVAYFILSDFNLVHGFTCDNIVVVIKLLILFGFELFIFAFMSNLYEEIRKQYKENNQIIVEYPTYNSMTPKYFYAAEEKTEFKN